MERLPKHRGLQHLALFVRSLEATLAFYTQSLGMQIHWQPDSDNVYLTSGQDSLALHRAKDGLEFQKPQRLDHLGFIVETPEAVDAWYQHLVAQRVTIQTPPRNHRDGARSLYCLDPDGNVVQFIYLGPMGRWQTVAV